MERGKKLERVELPDLVQIVFSYSSDENQQELLYCLTWNLERNIEYAMMQINDIDLEQGHNFICKGYGENMNYLMTEDGMYDLRFMAPLPFIKVNKNPNNFYKVPKSINERKISKNQSLYLGVGNMNMITTSYTLYNLVYWQEFQYYTRFKKIEPSIIHLQHFSPLFNNSTVFHMHALNRKIMKIVYDEVKKFEGEWHENPFRSLFLLLVYQDT